ncbi:MAG: hypothetical protein HUK01_08495 [Bacteroidaceae bacterium]|nr:hypothetical protein [Bacteroidaceae bacterium]
MLALEILVGDSASIIVAAENNVIADFSYGIMASSPDHILIAGFDDLNQYVWLDGTPHNGDTITIRVIDVNVDMVSTPIKTQPRNIESIKKKFLSLRNELQHRGLI